MARHSRAAAAAIVLALAAPLPGAALAQSATPDIEQPQDRVLSDVEMLMIGARLNRADVVLHQLSKGVEVDARGKNGLTALMVAAGRGSLDVIKLLLARGADVNLTNDEGWTALMEAVFRERERAARMLLRAGADVNGREKRNGLTPLMIAARTDKLGLVTALLANGADINAASTERGLTALHLVLGSDRLSAEDIAAELLAAGADAGKAARDGFTPLMAAVRSGSPRRVTLILSEKPDVNAMTDDGREAITIAARYGDAEIVRRLLDAGANALPAAGAERPLTEAVRGGSPEVVRLLIEHGASPDEPGVDGKTPLIIAAQIGNEEIVRLLLDRGADVNGRNPVDGTTPLMWAANNGRRSIVQVLLDHGADATLVAKDGWTAGEAARMAGHVEIARTLERRI
jgi:ankyrin repeat protein